MNDAIKQEVILKIILGFTGKRLGLLTLFSTFMRSEPTDRPEGRVFRAIRYAQ